MCSCSSTLRALRGRFGPLAGKPVTATKNLGIDFAAGRRPSRGTGAVWASRLKNFKLRKKRYRKLVAAAGTKANKVVLVGLRPALTYGAEVTGLSDSLVGVLCRAL